MRVRTVVMGGLEMEIKQRANGNRPTLLGSSAGLGPAATRLKKPEIERLYRIDTGKSTRQWC